MITEKISFEEEYYKIKEEFNEYKSKFCNLKYF